MNHPASRWSAAALFLVAAAVAVWFVIGGTPGAALADFAEPLISAKTAKFKLTSRANGKVIAVANMLVSGTRMRMEVEAPDGRNQITIMDEQEGVEFILLPDEKRAEIVRQRNRPERIKTGGFLAEIRKMLLDGESDGKTSRESLGQREVDGQRLEGFRIANPAMTLELWGDLATGRAHSISQTLSAYPSMTTTMSEFQFDISFDQSLLSLEPPEGYQVSEREANMARPTEDDLLAALRTAAEINGGVFPDALDMEVGHGLVKEFRNQNKDQLPAGQLDERSRELTAKFARGFGFTRQFAADKHHYAGKGVKLDAANKLIYWYRPEGNDSYCVIYADLSTAERDKVPNAE